MAYSGRNIKKLQRKQSVPVSTAYMKKQFKCRKLKATRLGHILTSNLIKYTPIRFILHMYVPTPIRCINFIRFHNQLSVQWILRSLSFQLQNSFSFGNKTLEENPAHSWIIYTSSSALQFTDVQMSFNFHLSLSLGHCTISGSGPKTLIVYVYNLC